MSLFPHLSDVSSLLLWSILFLSRNWFWLWLNEVLPQMSKDFGLKKPLMSFALEILILQQFGLATDVAAQLECSTVSFELIIMCLSECLDVCRQENCSCLVTGQLWMLCKYKKD
jgi:hypothetical protein